MLACFEDPDDAPPLTRCVRSGKPPSWWQRILYRIGRLYRRWRYPPRPVGPFDRFVMPNIRAAFPTLSVVEIVSANPMTKPHHGELMPINLTPHGFAKLAASRVYSDGVATDEELENAIDLAASLSKEFTAQGAGKPEPVLAIAKQFARQILGYNGTIPVVTVVKRALKKAEQFVAGLDKVSTAGVGTISDE